MAYVRRRGNQVAIVHGERESNTGAVQQRIPGQVPNGQRRMVAFNSQAMCAVKQGQRPRSDCKNGRI